MAEKLTNPPINELIIGVYFNPALLDLYTHHIGIFWERIRDGYPRVEQREPIGNLYIDVANEMFPMPRFWFTSADQSHLVQVQRNAFLLNWRKRNAEYPSFDPVKAEFDRLYAVFAEFVRDINADAPMNIDRAELTYGNQIDAADYWSGPADTVAVLPSYQPLGDLVPIGLNVQQTSQHDARTNVVLSVRNGERKPDNIKTLILEIRAVGTLGGATKSQSDDWFQVAHDVTGSTFKAVTNTDIRDRYWNKGAADARSR